MAVQDITGYEHPYKAYFEIVTPTELPHGVRAEFCSASRTVSIDTVDGKHFIHLINNAYPGTDVRMDLKPHSTFRLMTGMRLDYPANVQVYITPLDEMWRQGVLLANDLHPHRKIRRMEHVELHFVNMGTTLHSIPAPGYNPSASETARAHLAEIHIIA